MEKEELEKEVSKFFKASFIVDGEVKVLYNCEDFQIDSVIELNDSERGRFYIGRLSNNQS